MGLFDFGISNKKRQMVMDAVLGSQGQAPVENYDLFDGDFLSQLGLKKGEERKAGKLTSELQQETRSRKDRYEKYKKVCKDPIIGQAIEMMADDATQFDVDRERTVWVESTDKEYQNAINGIIEDYLEPFIDNIASGILSKGEFGFKINKGKTNKRGAYKDLVLIPYKNIERLHHLILPDQDRIFFEVDDIRSMPSEGKVLSGFKEFTEFLHFINYSIENSEEVELEVEREGNKEKVSVFVLQGESILTDKVLETFDILQMLERSLVQYRLSKSRLVRFVNVDVTKLTDNAKAQAIVNYIHGAVAVNESVDYTRYNVSAEQEAPVVVTIPSKNGVGQVTVSEFNSDVNIKDIADIDHFLNKIFAALRTPRIYFNYDEALPGLNASGTSLVRTDLRYARSVKKVQRVIVNGVKDLVWVFNELNGIKQDEKQVKIKIVKVTSAENVEKQEEVEKKLDSAGRLIQTFTDPQTGELNIALIEVLVKFFTYVSPSSEIVDFLNALKTKVNIVNKPTDVKLKGPIKTEPEE